MNKQQGSDTLSSSHLVPRLHKRIASMYPTCSVSTLDLFYHSTIESQTRLLCERHPCTNEQIRAEDDCNGSSSVAAEEAVAAPSEEADEHSLAIIGIAGKLPGANNPDELYANLTQGVSGIRDSPTRISAPNDPTCGNSSPPCTRIGTYYSVA